MIGALAAVGLLGGTWVASSGDDEATTSSQSVGTVTAGADYAGPGAEYGPTDNLPTMCSIPATTNVSDVGTGPSGYVVDVSVIAACEDGDVIVDSTATARLTSGERTVAQGAVDFSRSPLLVPRGYSDALLAVTFPFDTIQSMPAYGTSTFDIELTYRALGSDYIGSSIVGGGSVTAVPLSTATTSDSTTVAQLRATANEDRGRVSSMIEDRWAPQISSKRPGLYAEGITWTPRAILQEYFQMRITYPDSALVWSGDWSTFSAPDWWVIIVASPQPTPDAALAWCRDNGMDRDHCYAKIVSRSRTVDGSTKLMPS